jgi:hypothetical protein
MWKYIFILTEEAAYVPSAIMLYAQVSENWILRFSTRHREKFYSVVVVLICLALAGPEIGIGFELIGLVDLLGIELFLFCFTAPLWFYWYRIQSWLYKSDPYFFIPSSKQILACPNLLAHAIPGHIVLLLWASSICVFTS